MLLSRNEIRFYEEYKEKCFNELNKLRVGNGLFVASEYYSHSWHRDNMMCNLAYLNNYPDKYTQTIHTTLDLLKKFESKYTKLSSVLKYGITENNYLLHAKFDINTMDEIPNLQWNNAQWDNQSLILINIAYGIKEGLNIIRDDSDRKIIQLLIDYTIKIGYNPNASSWEEEDQQRTSSTALTVKALELIKECGFNVPQQYIFEGYSLLGKLALKEHDYKDSDLMLLYLPTFDIVDKITTCNIIEKVERDLLRESGVIRYRGDYYYNKDGKEMEWSFGLSYLSICYNKLGVTSMAKFYIDKIIELYPDAKIPEGVYGGTNIKNDNDILAWAIAVQIQAIDMLLENKYIF